MMKKKLGVNIDHIATLRQARREFDPDPVEAAKICENAGADSIVAHLREDRRHIQESDLRRLKKELRGRLNFEISLDQKVMQIAASIGPDLVTLVPEKRAELTTEGGLDVVKNCTKIRRAVKLFHSKKIEVSLFIDPVKKQIDQSKKSGAVAIEIHTGNYANAKNPAAAQRELKKIKEMATYAHKLGLIVNAGHGLKYNNTQPIATIAEMNELNIGHSIVSRAAFVGLGNAVREMLIILGQK